MSSSSARSRSSDSTGSLDSARMRLPLKTNVAIPAAQNSTASML
jgi:hypothetical protein